MAVVNLHEDCVVCVAENDPTLTPANAVRILLVDLMGGTERGHNDAEGAFGLMVRQLCFKHRRELSENVRACRAAKG